MWQPVGNREALEKGVRYRSHYYLKLPYSSTMAGILTGAVAAAKPTLRALGYEVFSSSTASPELTEQSPGGRYTRWRLTIEWQRV